MKKHLSERKLARSKVLAEAAQNKTTVVKGQTGKDSGDEALSLSMEKLQSSIEQSGIDEIRHIDDALARIEKDEYGQCIDCLESISEKRLEHFPYAARCIVCQEAFEEKE